MAEFDLDKMASRMAEKALDEFICNGKTLREWIEIIVAQDLLAIAELEKVKEKIFNKQDEFIHSNLLSECNVRYGLEIAETIIDKEIAELKGENNDL